MSDELRELDRALCNLLNGAFDPYDPVDLWRDEVWNAMAELSRAYNDAHVARCFPDWRSDPTVRVERKAFQNWRREVMPHRMMILADEYGRPLSAQALSADGKPIADWSKPTPSHAEE